MGYVLTSDVCQPAISGRPIQNDNGFIFVNKLTGTSGIMQPTSTYASAVTLCNSLDGKLTSRFDDTTYYGT